MLWSSSPQDLHIRVSSWVLPAHRSPSRASFCALEHLNMKIKHSYSYFTENRAWGKLSLSHPSLWRWSRPEPPCQAYLKETLSSRWLQTALHRVCCSVSCCSNLKYDRDMDYYEPSQTWTSRPAPSLLPLNVERLTSRADHMLRDSQWRVVLFCLTTITIIINIKLFIKQWDGIKT